MRKRPFTLFVAVALCASCGGAATSDSNGLVLVTGALVCVDSGGNPVPGGTCGEDAQCRDENGFVIEGTMCVEEGAPDDGDSDSDSDSADSDSDSDSDRDSDQDQDSDSDSAGRPDHGDHDSDGDSDSDSH